MFWYWCMIMCITCFLCYDVLMYSICYMYYLCDLYLAMLGCVCIVCMYVGLCCMWSILIVVTGLYWYCYSMLVCMFSRVYVWWYVFIFVYGCYVSVIFIVCIGLYVYKFICVVALKTSNTHNHTPIPKHTKPLHIN